MGVVDTSFASIREEYDAVERPCIAVPPGGAEVKVLRLGRRCSKRQRKIRIGQVSAMINRLEDRLAEEGPNEEISDMITRLRHWRNVNSCGAA